MLLFQSVLVAFPASLATILLWTTGLHHVIVVLRENFLGNFL